uniref:ShKT domain-containing protein n=1 Tax=Ditylenchus dipsaci TaxID=166011 RepID=A0A915CYS6_9BILA
MKRKKKRPSNLYRCSDGVDSPALCTVDSVEGHVCSFDHKLRCELSRKDLKHHCCARESDSSSGGSDSGSDEDCVDTGTNCENRMTASGTHWCILPQYYERMMVDCRKTCNRCKGKCEDLNHPDTGVSDCADRKDEGYCDREIYKDLMVWQCPKMCGWKCDSKTDRPPPKRYTKEN